MTTFLLPKRGVGNAASFATNYTAQRSMLDQDSASQPPYLWSDTSVFYYSLKPYFTCAVGNKPEQYLRMYGGTVDGASGFRWAPLPIPDGTTSGSIGYSSGWCAYDVWAAEFCWTPNTTTTLNYATSSARWLGDNIISTIKKPFTINGHSYELLTYALSDQPCGGSANMWCSPIANTSDLLSISADGATLSCGAPATYNLRELVVVTGKVLDNTNKWYWEMVIGPCRTDLLGTGVGVSSYQNVWGGYPGKYLGQQTSNVGYWSSGTVVNGGVVAGTSFPSYTTNDVISVAYDAINNRIWYAKNGVWINAGDPGNGTNYFSTSGITSNTAVIASQIRAQADAVAGNASVTLRTSGFSFAIPAGFVSAETATVDPSPSTTGITQTITMVPYGAADNTAASVVKATFTSNAFGQYPNNGSEAKIVFSISCNDGCTTYVHWGKAAVNDVQQWIISDLVESEGFASAPNASPSNYNITPVTLASTQIGVVGDLRSRANHTPGPNEIIPKSIYEWTTPQTGGFVMPVMSRSYYGIRTQSWIKDQLNAPTNFSGRIMGVVQEDGVPVSGCLVRLYRRETGTLVDTVMTNTSGEFLFSLLDPTIASYMVIALDPDSGLQYNARVYDRLTPTVGPLP